MTGIDILEALLKLSQKELDSPTFIRLPKKPLPGAWAEVGFIELSREPGTNKSCINVHPKPIELMDNVDVNKM